MSINRYRLFAVLLFLCLVVFALIVLPGESQAAAGGVFVKSMAKTWWGKTILGFIFFVLLPLGIFVMSREWLGKRRTRRDLDRLAEKYPYFAWPDIERQANQCFTALYSRWSEGDLSPARNFMTPAYYQSQQDMLDRWREEGKRNVITLKSKPSFQPLNLRVEDEDSHSSVAIMVTVDLVDYLEDIATEKVHKGRKRRVNGFESIWIFLHEGGAWQLFAIEDGDQSLSFIGKNSLDTSYLERTSAHAPAARPASAEEDAADAEDSARRG